MKQFWHWMRVSAASMAMVCVLGIVAILVLPVSVWTYVLPGALLGQGEETRAPQPSSARVAEGPAAPPTVMSSWDVTPLRTAAVKSTVTVTSASGQAMYVCGYERCRDSERYGEQIFERDVGVWAVPDPEDARVHHKVSHHDEVHVLDVLRLWQGPGGLWIGLEEGGWLSELWLSDVRCTPENLADISFADCGMGEY